jgi:hypothetical protein
MNHHDGERYRIPFPSYSHIFSTGSDFMPREKFTPRMVVKLFNFKPRAMNCQVISEYVDVSRPNFLIDLAQYDPALFALAVELEPAIEEVVQRTTPHQLKISQLWKYSGRIEIDGIEYFHYSSGRVKGKVDLPQLPTDKSVTVEFKARPDTLCTVLDQRDAIKLWKRAQKEKA